MNTLSRIISVVFHPLLMPTYLFAFLAWALPSALAPLQSGAHLTFILLIFFVTFLFPLINIGIFKLFGMVNSFDMKDRKERIIPFTFTSLIYLSITGLFYFKSHIGLDENFLKLLVIIDMLVIVSTIATFFMKVSIHSVCVWGITGMVLLLTKIAEVNTLFYATVTLIALAGFIMSARLQLGAHTYREVMLGGVLGLATSITGMLLLF